MHRFDCINKYTKFISLLDIVYINVHACSSCVDLILFVGHYFKEGSFFDGGILFSNCIEYNNLLWDIFMSRKNDVFFESLRIVNYKIIHLCQYFVFKYQNCVDRTKMSLERNKGV